MILLTFKFVSCLLARCNWLVIFNGFLKKRFNARLFIITDFSQCPCEETIIFVGTMTKLSSATSWIRQDGDGGYLQNPILHWLFALSIWEGKQKSIFLEIKCLHPKRHSLKVSEWYFHCHYNTQDFTVMDMTIKVYFY